MFDRIFVFVRNITLCVIILCLASLFVGLPFAEAHPDTEEFEEKFDEAEQDVENAYDERDKWRDHYIEAKAAIDTLLSEWDSNEESIKDNTWSFTNTVAATVISMILDAVLTDDSGDGGATKTDWFKELVETLPAILAAINAAKTGSDLADDLSAREAYLLSLSTAVSALDEIKSQNQAAFNAYESKYDKYVELMQNHEGGLVRDPNHNSSGDYSSVTAWSLETIKSTVKDKDAYNAVDSLNKLKFWYHVDDLKSTSHPSSQTIDRFNDFETFWKLKPPLPENKACGGDCGQQFRTPVEHLVVCPNALSADAAVAAAPAGCDRAYYTCKTDDINEHRIRLCQKKKDAVFLGQKIICNAPYRNCNNLSYDHVAGLPGKTKHNDVAQNTQTPETPTSTPTPTPTTPSYHACGIHETSVSGNHSLVAINSWSLHCTTHSFYACQANDHIAVSCSETNGWGHSCNVTHYKCDQTQTHTFPTFSCGRRTCTQTVADPEEHRRTCINGHKYWSCNPSAVEWHKTRNPCTKLKVKKRWNSQHSRYEGVSEVCGESWAKCYWQSCIDMYRRIRYHKE